MTHGGAAGAWVTIEKRKWDGRVSARWPVLLASDGPRWAWWSPAGTVRARPWRDAAERLARAEVVLAGDGNWLLTVAIAPDGAPRTAVVDAILPVRCAGPDLVAFVDLDLDLTVDLARGRARLRDEDDLARNAHEMRYPAWVVDAAWRGVHDATTRLAEGRWPFGDLAAALAAAAPPASAPPPRAGRAGALTTRMGGT
ncbi:MAG: hypothetical protein MUE51_06265 [Thermoleophilia bacterium]|jgi:hypothetical protein|nr:hypothetical protein [Thermoleophilia bacterium]